MFEFSLLTILLIALVILSFKNNIFFNYIRIKIKVIGLDIEIKSKEKSTPSSKDKC